MSAFSLLEGHGFPPLGVLTVTSAFPPAALVLYLDEPALFEALDLVPLLLLAAALCLPVVLLCSIAVLAWHDAEQSIVRGSTNSSPDENQALAGGALVSGSLVATAILYAIAGFAYLRPVRIGATFLIVGAALVVANIFAVAWRRRQLDAKGIE